MSDFIIVPRSIFEPTAFGREAYTKMEAFLDLVQMAVLEPTEVSVKGYAYTANRGEVVASKTFLSQRWGWNTDKVRRFLDYLEKTDRCKVECDRAKPQPITRITVIGYDRYTTLAPIEKPKAEPIQEPKPKPKPSMDEAVERIYKLYPTKCPVKGTSTGKCSKDKVRIASLLKTRTEASITASIKEYLEDSAKDGRYIKNFSTLLNNLPDVEEPKPEEPTRNEPKQDYDPDLEYFLRNC